MSNCCCCSFAYEWVLEYNIGKDLILAINAVKYTIIWFNVCIPLMNKWAVVGGGFWLHTTYIRLGFEEEDMEEVNGNGRETLSLVLYRSFSSSFTCILIAFTPYLRTKRVLLLIENHPGHYYYYCRSQDETANICCRTNPLIYYAGLKLNMDGDLLAMNGKCRLISSRNLCTHISGCTIQLHLVGRWEWEWEWERVLHVIM